MKNRISGMIINCKEAAAKFMPSKSLGDSKNSGDLSPDLITWAKTRRIESEQLAMDVSRLMGFTEERLQTLKNQGFVKRCVSRLSGKTGMLERANTHDLIELQHKGFQFIKILEEQQIFSAYAIMSLRCNLDSAWKRIASIQKRQLAAVERIKSLAEAAQARFEYVEDRIDSVDERVDQIEYNTEQLEVWLKTLAQMTADNLKAIEANFSNHEKRLQMLEKNDKLNSWLLILEERSRNMLNDAPIMRMLTIISEFYTLDNDTLDYPGWLKLKKALRVSRCQPEDKMTLRAFITNLADELLKEGMLETFDGLINSFNTQRRKNFTQFVIEQISTPALPALLTLNDQYVGFLDTIIDMREHLQVSGSEAIQSLCCKSIEKLHYDLDSEFTIIEIAVQLLQGARVASLLGKSASINKTSNVRSEKLKIYYGQRGLEIILKSLDSLLDDNNKITKRDLFSQTQPAYDDNKFKDNAIKERCKNVLDEVKKSMHKMNNICKHSQNHSRDLQTFYYSPHGIDLITLDNIDLYCFYNEYLVVEMPCVGLWIGYDPEKNVCGFFVKNPDNIYFESAYAKPGLISNVNEKFSKLRNKRRQWHEADIATRKKIEKLKTIAAHTLAGLIVTAAAIPYGLWKGGEIIIKTLKKNKRKSKRIHIP